MRSFLKSFEYAVRGIGFNLAYERNYRIHCFAGLTVVLAGILFYDFSKVEWGLLALLIATVISCESLNTAIEQTDNRITMEHSPQIRNSKDSAAAAVMLVAVVAVIVGVLLFWDLKVFGEILAFFSVWYRLVLLILYFAVILFFIFCKKTYKKEK